MDDSTPAIPPVLDGCPECCYNTELPLYTRRVENATRAVYLCADCGHRWTTDRRD